MREPYVLRPTPNRGDATVGVAGQLKAFEKVVIAHVEAATGLKHIIVDGESRYVNPSQLEPPIPRPTPNPTGRLP